MKNITITIRSICAGAFFSGFLFGGQAGAPASAAPAEAQGRVQTLRQQLLWSDKSSHEHYSAVKEGLTAELFATLDSFIEQTFDPAKPSNTDQLKRSLDAEEWLGRKNSDIHHTFVFPVEIPAGKFLIVGIEIPRGGPAIAEDAISFRAYSQTQGAVTLVDHVELVGTNGFLFGLNALPLPGKLPGNFAFIAWADEPPLSPNIVIAHVYSFDGQKFATIWTSEKNLMAAVNLSSFVTVTSTGFDLNTLAPDRVDQIVQSYAVASGAVTKIGEVNVGPRP